jgi:hypothetical protein
MYLLAEIRGFEFGFKFSYLEDPYFQKRQEFFSSPPCPYQLWGPRSQVPNSCRVYSASCNTAEANVVLLFEMRVVAPYRHDDGHSKHI